MVPLLVVMSMDGRYARNAGAVACHFSGFVIGDIALYLFRAFALAHSRFIGGEEVIDLFGVLH